MERPLSFQDLEIIENVVHVGVVETEHAVQCRHAAAQEQDNKQNSEYDQQNLGPFWKTRRRFRNRIAELVVSLNRFLQLEVAADD